MLEAFEVGVTLKLTGNLTTQLEKIEKSFAEIESLATKSQEAIGRLSAELRTLGGSSRGISALVKAMEKLQTARPGNAAAEDIAKMASSTREAVAAQERLAAVLRENARLARDINMPRPGGGGPGGGRAPGGGGGRNGGHGGGFGGHDFLLTGIAAGMVGDTINHAEGNAFERAAEIEHTRQMIAGDQRVGNAGANRALEAAYAATKSAPGTSLNKNLESVLDLKNVMGSFDEALVMLPAFARMTAMLQVVDRKHGGSGDQAFAAAKAMEVMGGMVDEHTDASGHIVREINPELAQHRLDLMSRVAFATNGRVGPKDYLAFAKTARVAGMTLSDEFLYEKLPAIMMTLGGPRTGTALMSMMSVFGGNKLTDKSYDAMVAIGLAGPATFTNERNPRTGKMKKVRHNAGVYDLDLMFTDTALYLEKAEERMKKSGVKGDIRSLILAMLPAEQRATIAGYFADVMKDAPSIAKEQQNIRNTDPKIAEKLAANDPLAKMQQLSAAWDKLLATFGTAGMKDMIDLLDKVTSGLNSLGEWAKKNPGMARTLVDVGGGLGAVATGLGALSTAIFLFGPALKMLGGMGGGGAGAVGAGLATGPRVGLLARFGLPGAIAAGAVATEEGLRMELKTPGGVSPSLENNRKLEELNRQRRSPWGMEPQDGFGAAPSRSSSNNGPIPVVITNGRDLVRGIGTHMADQASLPSRGPRNFDQAMTPSFPSTTQ